VGCQTTPKVCCRGHMRSLRRRHNVDYTTKVTLNFVIYNAPWGFIYKCFLRAMESKDSICRRQFANTSATLVDGTLVVRKMKVSPMLNSKIH